MKTIKQTAQIQKARIHYTEIKHEQTIKSNSKNITKNTSEIKSNQNEHEQIIISNSQNTNYIEHEIK